MIALLFGLPLLTAYYNVNSKFYFIALAPYLAASVLITIVLILRSLSTPYVDDRNTSSSWIGKFNSIPLFFIDALAGWTIFLFALVRYFEVRTYPVPPLTATVTPIGEAYIFLLIVTSILAFPRIIYYTFPILRQILKERKYALMAFLFSVFFAIVYLLLVNQITIAGYNVQAVAPATIIGPAEKYPYAFAMTPANEQLLLNLVYLPVIIVQITPQVNLILVPFEMAFTTILSLLVASNIVMAHYLISNSGLKCSTKGTMLSTGGSILGLTATCPTCLVPAFVSVIFGGVTTAELLYSNVYGVVLPPILSVVALLVSVLYLSRAIRNRSHSKG